MIAPGMLLQALVLLMAFLNVQPLTLEESLSHHIVNLDADVLRLDGKDISKVKEELAALPDVTVHDSFKIGNGFRAVVISAPRDSIKQVDILVD